MYEMLVFLDFFLSYKGTIHILCIFFKRGYRESWLPYEQKNLFHNLFSSIVILQ